MWANQFVNEHVRLWSLASELASRRQVGLSSTSFQVFLSLLSLSPSLWSPLLLLLFSLPPLLPCSLFFTPLLMASFFSFLLLCHSPPHVVYCVEWSLFCHSVYLVWPVGTHKWTDGWLHESQVQNSDCNCQKSIHFSRWVWPRHQALIIVLGWLK